MPARERRSPSVGEICTMTRSKSTEMGCLSSLSRPGSALAWPVPFFAVDVGTMARYRTRAAFQVRGHERRRDQAGRTFTPCAAM